MDPAAVPGVPAAPPPRAPPAPLPAAAPGAHPPAPITAHALPAAQQPPAVQPDARGTKRKRTPATSGKSSRNRKTSWGEWAKEVFKDNFNAKRIFFPSDELKAAFGWEASAAQPAPVFHITYKTADGQQRKQWYTGCIASLDNRRLPVHRLGSDFVQILAEMGVAVGDTIYLRTDPAAGSDADKIHVILSMLPAATPTPAAAAPGCAPPAAAAATEATCAAQQPPQQPPHHQQQQQQQPSPGVAVDDGEQESSSRRCRTDDEVGVSAGDTAATAGQAAAGTPSHRKASGSVGRGGCLFSYKQGLFERQLTESNFTKSRFYIHCPPLADAFGFEASEERPAPTFQFRYDTVDNKTERKLLTAGAKCKDGGRCAHRLGCGFTQILTEMGAAIGDTVSMHSDPTEACHDSTYIYVFLSLKRPEEAATATQGAAEGAPVSGDAAAAAAAGALLPQQQQAAAGELTLQADDEEQESVSRRYETGNEEDGMEADGGGVVVSSKEPAASAAAEHRTPGAAGAAGPGPHHALPDAEVLPAVLPQAAPVQSAAAAAAAAAVGAVGAADASAGAAEPLMPAAANVPPATTASGVSGQGAGASGADEHGDVRTAGASQQRQQAQQQQAQQQQAQQAPPPGDFLGVDTGDADQMLGAVKAMLRASMVATLTGEQQEKYCGLWWRLAEVSRVADFVYIRTQFNGGHFAALERRVRKRLGEQPATSG